MKPKKNNQLEAGAGGCKPPVQLLTKADVARLLQLSPRTVSNLMACGLPHFANGLRRTRFVEAHVLAWLQAECAVQRPGK